MSRRIQAYFRTEDEAEGAKTALIPYGVDNLEVSPLTDPLKTDGNYRNNILIPLVPYNNSAMTGGAFGATGAVAGSGPIAGAPIVPAIDVNDGPDDLDNRSAGDVRNQGEFDDRDMDDLRYVMEVKVADGKQDEVIEALRRKRAYVEVFD